MLEDVFDIDALRCQTCGGEELEIIAAILQRTFMERNRTHLRLDPGLQPEASTRLRRPRRDQKG